MKLSILIPTLESRREKFGELRGNLLRQWDFDVQLLYETDNGELSVGSKRQHLLERAEGDYICFIDDDDTVPDDYVEKVLKAIESEPDCCSLSGELHWPHGDIEPFEHSIEYSKWEKKNGVYLRFPNHLNTVKRELALQTGFKDMGHGEDYDYSCRLRPLLKTESKIDGVIYHYWAR